MTVRTQAYEGYDGSTTSRLHRPFVIFRYAWSDLFASRLFSVFFTLCFLPSAIVMVLIYMRYNIEMLIQMDLRLDELVQIDASFFAFWMQGPQLVAAFVMILLTGPTLVAPDLNNNALSLYLSRSISRSGYVMGKLMVLVALCSVITWIPALGLILFQAWLAGPGWLMDNLNLLLAPVLVTIPWVIALSMMSLAVSAWVQWKVISRLVFFGLFFVGLGLGNAFNAVFSGWQGSLVKISRLTEVLIAHSYGVENPHNLPFWAAATTLLVLTIASGFLLSRRIRAFEVVS
jgi:ABC-type transport system involved in multi-copper enzyme maturation permease subunit